MNNTTPNEILAKVGAYLRQPLEGDIRTQLVSLESLRFELAEVRTDQLQLLHEKQNQMLYPKDKDFTELDRKVRLNASVAVINRDYELLVKVEELIKERLEFGMLLLGL